MIVIGIIGGVASGKSVVTETLGELGASVIDADELGHQVLRDPGVRQLVRARWGDRVFGGDGQVQRKKLGEIVFDPEHPDELAALEQITHPRINERIGEAICHARGASNVRALVLDAPVMIKAQWHHHCDVLAFVDCPYPQRLENAGTRGWSKETLERREAMQTDLKTKRSLATHIIENHGTLNELKNATRRFWNQVILPTEHGV